MQLQPKTLSGQARSLPWRSSIASVLFTTQLLSANAIAADWQSTNVQLLHGTKYADLNGAIDSKEKTVFTFEHADGWAYGDNFFFMDVSNPNTAGSAYYSEFSPRFSIGKMTGKDLSAGVIKDVMLAFTQEMGDGLHASLYGIGLPLDLPGFAFSDVNFYIRNSTNDAFGASQHGYQVTLDWLYPFAIGSTKWAFEGFLDYAAGEDGGDNPKKNNIITAPRLLLQVAKNVQFGFEYQVWRNKYGIQDVNENVAQVMLKWTM